MDSITLPADLEQFASDAVAAGRYRDMNDVVRTAVDMLQRAESEMGVFVLGLEAARAEADRDGWISADDMLSETDQVIHETANRAA